jgi:hypothetical protein
LSSSSSDDTSTEEDYKEMDYKEKYADYRIARSGGRFLVAVRDPLRLKFNLNKY